MATENIIIQIRETGSRVVRRSLSDLGVTADKSADSVDHLNRALKLIGGALSVSAIAKYADTYNRLQNRLAVVTGSTQQMTAATEALFKVAQDTRTSFEDTTELYSRLALSSKELGMSQKDLVRFTESVNKAVSLSGASAQEAKAGLIQLSQGLASGRLQGDELRSVLEQLPVVADVIAKGMGKTRGELRELGAAGKISAQEVVDAFAKAGNDLDERFGKKIPTIAESFTIVNNALTKFIGETDKGLGLTEKFGQAARWLADNMNAVGGAVMTLLPLLAALGTGAAIKGVIAAFGAITAFALANPLTAIAGALGGLIVGLGQFDDSMDDVLKAMGRTSTAADKLVATFAATRAYVESIWEDFPAWFEGMMARAVDLAVKQWAKLADKLKAGIEGVGKAIDSSLGDGKGKLFTNMFADIADQFKSSGELNQDLQFNADYLQRYPDAVRKAGDAAAQAYRDVILERSKLMSDLDGSAGKNLTKPGSDGGKVPRFSFAEAEADLIKQIELYAQEADVRERLLKIDALEARLPRNKDGSKNQFTQDQRDQLEDLIRVADQLERMDQMYQDIIGPQKSYSDNVQTLNRLLAEEAINQEQYNKKFEELQLTFLNTQTTVEAGLTRGIINLKTEMQDMASLVENGLTNAVRGLEDAFVQFVTTGKLSFADLVNSIMADMARLFVRQGITGPLMGALSTAIGGMFSGGIGVSSSFQSGGVASNGSGLSYANTGFTGVNGGSGMGVQGMKFATGGGFRVGGSGGIDSQVVAFRATPGEDVYVNTPGSTRGIGRGDGGTSVYVNIIGAPSEPEVEQTEDSDGNTQISVMFRRVEKHLAGRVNSGQGELHSSISKSFGVRGVPQGK